MRWRLMVMAGVMAAAPLPGGAATGLPVSSQPLLASTPGQPLTLTIGTKVQVASVTREGLTDGDVSLRRSPGQLNGHVGVESVHLRLEPQRVEGTLGDRSVGLDVVRSDGGLQVAGNFGIQSVAMVIRREGIDAQVGPCSYRLPFTLGRYRGLVDCGGTPVAAELTVPVALVRTDDRELAAIVTALFAR